MDRIYVKSCWYRIWYYNYSGTLLYLNGQLLKYVFMVVFTTALSFGLTYMFGYEDEASSVPAEDKEAEAIIEEETTGALPASLQDETISLRSLVKLLLCLM